METYDGIPDLESVILFFKSHHSGMETAPLTRPLGLVKTLNRTIVGWKPTMLIRGGNGGSALNRTIVGWKHDEVVNN